MCTPISNSFNFPPLKSGLILVNFHAFGPRFFTWCLTQESNRRLRLLLLSRRRRWNPLPRLSPRSSTVVSAPVRGAKGGISSSYSHFLRPHFLLIFPISVFGQNRNPSLPFFLLLASIPTQRSRLLIGHYLRWKRCLSDTIDIPLPLRSEISYIHTHLLQPCPIPISFTYGIDLFSFLTQLLLYFFKWTSSRRFLWEFLQSWIAVFCILLFPTPRECIPISNPVN